jgi:hypothetical protein
MCGFHDQANLAGSSDASTDDPSLEPLAVAEFIAREEEIRRTAPGFIGYGSTGPGDRVLVAVDNHYEYDMVTCLVDALRKRGAKVDVIVEDAGPDRPFSELDEFGVLIRRESREINPRRWDASPWIERLAKDRKYDLLIHRKGGGIPATPHRYEAIPWLSWEHLLSHATTFPRRLHELINIKAWEPFHKLGLGGRVRVSDPEGTDLSYTLFPDYFDGTRRAYGETPFWGHLLGHGPTPILPEEDASGVVAGTTAHFSRPFPRIELGVEAGRVTSISGGSEYGAAWLDLMNETQDTQYPSFPRPGLFYLWEVAIGTNPRVVRPSSIEYLSSGGFEWERRRSGVVHMGFGTRWGGPEEDWAAERGIAYGHLHVHLLFPTIEITTPDGQVLEVIKEGRLSALDDPEVRDLASTLGDSAELLTEDWTPEMPGITGPGKYEDYARDPAKYIYA